MGMKVGAGVREMPVEAVTGWRRDEDANEEAEEDEAWASNEDWMKPAKILARRSFPIETKTKERMGQLFSSTESRPELGSVKAGV